jgi:hypothetical protein
MSIPYWHILSLPRSQRQTFSRSGLTADKDFLQKVAVRSTEGKIYDGEMGLPSGYD